MAYPGAHECRAHTCCAAHFARHVAMDPHPHPSRLSLGDSVLAYGYHAAPSQAYFKQETVEGIAEHAVIAQLPEHLRSTVLFELHIDLIQACPWMQETSFACCCDFLLALRSEVLLRGDVLLQAGVVTRQFYILMSGELQVTFPPEGGELSKLSALMGENSAVKNKRRSSTRVPQGRVERMGSLIGWTPPHQTVTPLAYTATATRDSMLHSIHRHQLAVILEQHPEEASVFKQAYDHSIKVLHPVKARLSECGKTGENGGAKPARRCSVSDKLRETGAGTDGGRSTASTASKLAATLQQELDEEGAINAARDGGWLPCNKTAPTAASNVMTVSSPGAQEPAVAKAQQGHFATLDTNDKLEMMFAEMMQMKQALASIALEVSACVLAR